MLFRSAGVVESVAVKVSQLYSKKASASKIILTGGLSHSSYFAHTLAEKIGKPVETMELGRFAGAIGAALLAEEKAKATATERETKS